MNKKIIKEEMEDWDSRVDFYRNESYMPFNKLIKKDFDSVCGDLSGLFVLNAGAGVSKHAENEVLIDLSFKMVAAAREEFDNIKGIVCSTHKLPFKDKVFNAVVAKGLYHHLKAQGIMEESSSEFSRVLKKNGKLCIYDRAFNFIPNLLFCLRKPFKIFISSRCSTRNEVSFKDEDIEKICDAGFEIVKRKRIVNVFFQNQRILSNLIQYSLGFRAARLFQKKSLKLAELIEKSFRNNSICAEQIILLKKK